MKRIFGFPALAGALVLVLAVCCGGSGPGYLPGPVRYAAGYEFNAANKAVATVWKLMDGGVTPIPLTNGPNGAEAYALEVYGGDLYAAGFESDGTKAVAKVWKLTDGAVTFIALTSGSNNAYAHALTVYGSDLYAGGYESDGAKNAAKVWKVTAGTFAEFTALTNGANPARATALAVDGSDLYAAGDEFSGSMLVTKVWKLTGGAVTPIPLSNETYNAAAYALLLVWE
ncbi:MAG: hypothetical protein LBK74_01980 [Treponema sp.]|jgi:hypothetical protein|nr:hypothetical protein [Treponema sp.]